MDILLPVETRVLQERRMSLRVVRRQDQTPAIRTQQCVQAIVEFGMLAVDVRHVLVLDRVRMLHNLMPITLRTRMPPTRVGAPCNDG